MSAMTFSFGPHMVEDRVWMRFNQSGDLIWFSRRLAQFLLCPVADRFSQSLDTQSLHQATKGHVPANAIEVEHELSISELEAVVPQSSAHKPLVEAPPVQYGADPLSEEQLENSVLCKTITMTANENGIELLMESLDGRQFEMRMSRAGFHRFLRALWLVVSRMDWNIANVPDWLSKDYSPLE